MEKNIKIKFLILTFLLSIISMFTIAARSDFTIEKYWEEGGMITFEYDYYINHELDIFDFDSTIKFSSGTGWPSFTQPIKENGNG